MLLGAGGASGLQGRWAPAAVAELLFFFLQSRAVGGWDGDSKLCVSLCVYECGSSLSLSGINLPVCMQEMSDVITVLSFFSCVHKLWLESVA